LPLFGAVPMILYVNHRRVEGLTEHFGILRKCAVVEVRNECRVDIASLWLRTNAVRIAAIRRTLLVVTIKSLILDTLLKRAVLIRVCGHPALVFYH